MIFHVSSNIRSPDCCLKSDRLLEVYPQFKTIKESLGLYSVFLQSCKYFSQFCFFFFFGLLYAPSASFPAECVPKQRVLVLKVLQKKWFYCSFLFRNLISLHSAGVISLDMNWLKEML